MGMLDRAVVEEIRQIVREEWRLAESQRKISETKTPKALRVEKGFDLRTLAATVNGMGGGQFPRVKISPTTISQYEDGRISRFSGSVLLRLVAIAQALGVPEIEYRNAVLSQSETMKFKR